MVWLAVLVLHHGVLRHRCSRYLVLEPLGAISGLYIYTSLILAVVQVRMFIRLRVCAPRKKAQSFYVQGRVCKGAISETFWTSGTAVYEAASAKKVNKKPRNWRKKYNGRWTSLSSSTLVFSSSLCNWINSDFFTRLQVKLGFCNNVEDFMASVTSVTDGGPLT